MDGRKGKYEASAVSLLLLKYKCAACYKQYKKKEHLVEYTNVSFHSVHQPRCGVCKKHFKSFESQREHITGLQGTTMEPCEEFKYDINSSNEYHVGDGTEAIALDCEMVAGGSDGSLDLCARVCLIDEDETILFHTFMQPQDPVINYRY
ncbi:hypothetical protein ACE6H2_005604 [Prunus campanulata]